MNRIPPALLYLTIFNSTLRPLNPVDDEDAEQQAQILFYTSCGQAVSRDKMLRQVGLAKALVNFAETFHSTGPYQNVHSQTRRMIMLSPEPNFWIHASFELAKTPQPPPSKRKGKGKAKEMSTQNAPLEHHDSSLHDSAIRAHLKRGYEQFKLLHGSFTSTITSEGQQVLQSRLEHFFSLWAWSWSLEGASDLKSDLGLPLHPSYHLILPIIDTFSSNLPSDQEAIVLTPDYVAPSSRYKTLHYPTVLARHLMTLVPPVHHEAIMTQPGAKPSLDTIDPTSHGVPAGEGHASNGFLGISAMKNMDIRKWGWTSGFSLSRSPDARSGNVSPVDHGSPPKSISSGHVAQVDQSALEDAISNNSFGSVEREDEESTLGDMSPSAAAEEKQDPVGQDDSRPYDIITPRPSRTPSPTSASSKAASITHQTTGEVDKSYGIHFTRVGVFLASNDEPLATRRHTICVLERNGIAVALPTASLSNDASNYIETLAPLASRILEEIDIVISTDARKTLDSSLPSAKKILEPRDNHMLNLHGYVSPTTEFPLGQDYLYDGKDLLERQPNVVEVFSRTLNPQHWHVVHRGNERGEMYLQVARKEASLSDVDNVLQKLYKTHI